MLMRRRKEIKTLGFWFGSIHLYNSSSVHTYYVDRSCSCSSSPSSKPIIAMAGVVKAVVVPSCTSISSIFSDEETAYKTLFAAHTCTFNNNKIISYMHILIDLAGNKYQHIWMILLAISLLVISLVLCIMHI